MRFGRRRAAVALAALVALVALTGGALAQAASPPLRPDGGAAHPPASRRFMVVAAHPLAVDAGYAVLREGGSAVDAAIAVQLVLNLVEPQSSGIGGGAFMLVHDAKRRHLFAYDGRETAPAAARPDRFLDRDGKPLAFFDAVVGGRSVGVPGTVALLAVAHRRHGRLPWARLFAPAIALAQDGFPVSARLHAALAAERHFTQPRARAYFFDADGRPRAAGSRLANPEFAATLRALAAGGAAAFYTGAIARDVVATVAREPGESGRPHARRPVRLRGQGPRRGVRNLPAPSRLRHAAAVLGRAHRAADAGHAGALRPRRDGAGVVLERALHQRGRPARLRGPRRVHGRSGVLRAADVAARSCLSGPALAAHPDRREHGARRAGVAARRRRSGRRAAWGTHAALELPSTSHISIVDACGNAVAMTTTIENAFGSRLMTAGGFLLNNELTDFSFVPVADGKPVANRVEGGKRPRSSMAPTIVYGPDGRVFMVTGSMGGATIPNQVVKTLVAVIDWGLHPQAAVALPNFGSRNGPTELEQGTAVARARAEARGVGARHPADRQPRGRAGDRAHEGRLGRRLRSAARWYRQG